MLPFAKLISEAVNKIDSYTEQKYRQKMGKREILEGLGLVVAEKAFAIIFVNKFFHSLYLLVILHFI